MKTWDINKHSVILRDEFEFMEESYDQSGALSGAWSPDKKQG